MKFSARITGQDSLGLAPLLERFANEQWLADHYTPEDAVAFILDRFKRRLTADLEMIELVAETKSSTTTRAQSQVDLCPGMSSDQPAELRCAGPTLQSFTPRAA